MSGTRRGIGSVTKERSGRYRLRFTDPYGARQSGGTFATKALAENELRRISRAIESGTWVPNSHETPSGIPANKLTLRQLGEQWREGRVSKRGLSLSPNTIRFYEGLMNSSLDQFADKPIRSITASQVETWFSAERRRAPNQASKAYKHLRQLFEHAIKRGYAQVNPCQIEGAGNYMPATVPDVPTLKQVDAMIRDAVFPWKALIALAAWGGFRKGELLELRRKDVEKVDLDGEVFYSVKVRRAVIWVKAQPVVREPKTPGSIREVMLPQLVTDVLEEHLRQIPLGKEQLLFPSVFDASRHQPEFSSRRAWERAQSVSGYRGRFHSLRAFAATQYGLLGATAVELMERLGHRNVKTAMRYQRTTGREAALLRGLGS